MPDTIELPAPTAWPIVLAFGIDVALCGVGDQRFRQHSGRDLRACRLRWLVSRRAAAREARIRADRGESANCRKPRRPASRSRRMEDARNCSGRDCRWRSIRFQRVSKVAWREAWPWRFWRCSTEFSAVTGVWYPINLLAAGFFPARVTTEQIAAFHWDALDHCHDPPPHLFVARRASLWRDASDVSAPPDSAGRLHRAHPVVWPDPQHS